MVVIMPILGYGFFFDSPPKAMVALMAHIAFGLCMGAIIGFHLGIEALTFVDLPQLLSITFNSS
jgi:hypothetical protein